ncbi:unsaturated glucuronyl hydrolase Ugl88B [Butyrivibrio proteoclasticus B316]|uniref:Unsaturated glucuronyl hydrolase Ugl88B n=1 Tax=Butyrivibrio proteoclasticus (strain ATCC 51982 / DSM 14932 / B316) TaxID=515622 RepID=E0RVU0_BUTPB|nr:glycoside hydrolase family 88 protein [Butyrivibrio proteoclasticus]ADL35248.1 unsaturated glucuronyl hydrolase Ugl88B [Butyrivibrio proteoclasticus B316]
MNEYELIVSRTADELNSIMKVSPAQRAKDTVKKLLGRSVRSKDPMFWPSGMLMLGLTEAISNCKDKQELDKKIHNALEDHFRLWQNNYGSRIRFIDDSLAGYCMLRLGEKEHLESFNAGWEVVRDYLKTAKVDNIGSFIYNPGMNNRNIFADGVGMATLFLAADVISKLMAGESSFEDNTQNDLHYYNESDYVAIMGKMYTQFMNYHMYGRDDNSGLLYHGYQVSVDKKAVSKEVTCERKGLLGWGRAHGWMMLGMSEAAMLEMEIDKRSTTFQGKSIFNIRPWFREMCDTAVCYQRKDGGWSWQINAVEGHIDMSATGMIAYSIAKAYEAGLFDGDDKEKEILKNSLIKAKESMLSHAHGGIVTDALGSCDDFAVHYQNYGNYPWGQGAVLAALSVINRIE